MHVDADRHPDVAAPREGSQAVGNTVDAGTLHEGNSGSECRPYRVLQPNVEDVSETVGVRLQEQGRQWGSECTRRRRSAGCGILGGNTSREPAGERNVGEGARGRTAAALPLVTPGSSQKTVWRLPTGTRAPSLRTRAPRRRLRPRSSQLGQLRERMAKLEGLLEGLREAITGKRAA